MGKFADVLSLYKSESGNLSKCTQLTHSAVYDFAFAIAFSRQVYGEDFKNIIINPSTPTNLRLMDDDVLNNLRCGLDHFKNYVFAKVRKSVNQAARDLRKKSQACISHFVFLCKKCIVSYFCQFVFVGTICFRTFFKE